MNNFLDYEVFKSVVNNATLVSVDLCLVFNGQILMGKRNNEPLKDQWFTPGGRIQKNERWQDALRRIAASVVFLKHLKPKASGEKWQPPPHTTV